MNTFNIDDVTPVRLLERIASAKTDKDYMAYVARSKKLRPGINAEKLLDWRHLERRQHELHVQWHDYAKSYWKSLEDLSRASAELGCKNGMVWIMLNDSPYDSVMEVSKNPGYKSVSWSWTTKARLLENSIKTMNDPSTRALIVDGEDAANIFRFQKISEAKLKRWGVFESAFKEAVKERVIAFADAWLASSSSYHRYEETTFVVTNDDRSYVLNIKNDSCLRWLAGKVVSFV